MQVDWLKKSEEICGSDYESKFSPKPFDDYPDIQGYFKIINSNNNII